MNNSTRVLIYTVVGVLAVCALVYTFIAQQGRIGIQSGESLAGTPNALEQSIIAKLPVGLPSSTDWQVASATLVITNGQPFAYRVIYNTPQSVGDAYKTFMNYCLASGWRGQEDASKDNPNFRTMSCSNGGAFLYFNISSQTATVSNSFASSVFTSSVMVQYAPANSMLVYLANIQPPAGYPPDLPMVNDANLIYNGTGIYTVPQNKTYFTRIYFVDALATQVYSAYLEYLQSNHWVITSQTENKNIMATLDGNSAQVSVFQDGSTAFLTITFSVSD